MFWGLMFSQLFKNNLFKFLGVVSRIFSNTLYDTILLFLFFEMLDEAGQ